MSLSGDITRRLITIILEKAQTFGLDVAGSFLGPAWPFVKPLVAELIEKLPERIAKNWKNAADLAEEAEEKLREDTEMVTRIGKALDEHGITEAWATTVSEQLDGIADDVFEILCNQADAHADRQDIKNALDVVLNILKDKQNLKSAKIVVRGTEIEFVDLIRLPEDFMPSYQLAPSDFAIDSVKVNHMPAGFLIWSFTIWNIGGHNAVVNSLDLQVTGEGECPDGSSFDQLLPTLDPFEDLARLEPGRDHYHLFAGQRFTYAPDEHEAFRVQLLFIQDGIPRWQRLRPVINWSDATAPAE